VKAEARESALNNNDAAQPNEIERGEEKDRFSLKCFGVCTNGCVSFYELKTPLDQNDRYTGRIEAITEHELYIDAPACYKQGAKLNMHFSIPEIAKDDTSERRNSDAIHAIGKVKGCAQKAAGRFTVAVKITDIFEEDQKSIRRFVTSRSSDKIKVSEENGGQQG